MIKCTGSTIIRSCSASLVTRKWEEVGCRSETFFLTRSETFVLMKRGHQKVRRHVYRQATESETIKNEYHPILFLSSSSSLPLRANFPTKVSASCFLDSEWLKLWLQPPPSAPVSLSSHHPLLTCSPTSSQSPSSNHPSTPSAQLIRTLNRS